MQFIKKIAGVLVILTMVMACKQGASNNNASNANLKPLVQLNKTSHDFGIIQQGEKVSYVFKISNVGEGNLIIKDARASCGCTVPEFSTEPILPGESGEVEVVFDSENRTGKQVKTVTVYTNSEPNTTKLTITSDIVVPAL